MPEVIKYLYLGPKGINDVNRVDRGESDPNNGPKNMTEAANKVLIKKLTLRRAAEIYKLPYTSLQRVFFSRGVLKARGGQPVLDENAEKILTLLFFLLHLARRGFEITLKAVRKYEF